MGPSAHRALGVNEGGGKSHVNGLPLKTLGCQRGGGWLHHTEVQSRGNMCRIGVGTTNQAV